MEKLKEKKVGISQSNYIPWKGYFDLINSVDEFILYDDMQYTKRDWRNRNRIKTANGLHWLSIPVEVKGKYLQKINETKISNKSWNKEHWTIIKHVYGKAAFFDDNKAFFEELYLNCTVEYLSQINYRFLKAICILLNIETNITWSNKFELRGDKSEKILNICLDCCATEYFSGPAAKDYLDETLFKSNGVNVIWFDYSGYKEYDQLYPPFEHNVSILDVIFNTGPKIKEYMKQFTK